jgi:hypothetical protein
MTEWAEPNVAQTILEWKQRHFVSENLRNRVSTVAVATKRLRLDSLPYSPIGLSENALCIWQARRFS